LLVNGPHLHRFFGRKIIMNLGLTNTYTGLLGWMFTPVAKRKRYSEVHIEDSTHIEATEL